MDSSTLHPSTAAWSGVCMWPQRCAVTKEQIAGSLFSLVDGQAAAGAHKHHTAVYTLHRLETSLANSTLQLAPYTALVLECMAWFCNTLRGFATRRSACSHRYAYTGCLAGGIVVCSGVGCSATFTDVTFHHCTLVCLAGARVAVKHCSFVSEMEGTSAGVSVIADGALSLIHISEPTRPY